MATSNQLSNKFTRENNVSINCTTIKLLSLDYYYIFDIYLPRRSIDITNDSEKMGVG